MIEVLVYPIAYCIITLIIVLVKGLTDEQNERYGKSVLWKRLRLWLVGVFSWVFLFFLVSLPKIFPGLQGIDDLGVLWLPVFIILMVGLLYGVLGVFCCIYACQDSNGIYP